MLVTVALHILIIGSLLGIHAFTWCYDRKGGAGARNLFYSFVAAIVWVLFFTLILPSWMTDTPAERILMHDFNGFFYLIGLGQAGIAWPIFILITDGDVKPGKPTQVLSWFLGLLALGAAVGLAGVVFVLLALSRMGDGAGPYGPNSIQTILAYLPSLGLLLIAFSCLPFMRGLPLLIVGVTAHLIIGGIAILLIVGKGWWLVFPAMFFLIAWQALYRQRRMHDPAATTSTLGKLLLPPKPNTKPW